MKMLPKEINGLDLAFGPKNINEFLPDYNSVPDEFKSSYGNKNVEIVNRWFFQGLPKGTEFVPKKGIDPKMALGHIKACLGSFEPKHEHKTAGVAFLLNEWFEDIKIPEVDK